MNGFQMRSLFFYEVKKIACRKIVAVSMVSAILLILFTVCVPLLGDYYVDGTRISSNYEQFQTDAAYKKALDGRQIDDTLIREMQDAYSKVDIEEYRYSLKPAYQEYARPYSDIFQFIRQSTGLSGTIVINQITGTEDVKARRMVMQEERWKDLKLTEKEKEFWRGQEAKIENPVTYHYAEGYSVLFDTCYTFGIVGLFVIAACMSGVFPQEHIRKTDQLILSSRHGREMSFRVKFLAVICVSFAMISLLAGLTFAAVFLIYGAEGYDTAFQLHYVGHSLAISVGEAVLIAYVTEIITVVFMAVLVAVLSEVLHSSVAALAIATILIVAPMMGAIPEEYRFFSQLYAMLPGDFVAVWSIFDARMVSVFGKLFTMWQAVPVLYLVIGTGCILAAERYYVRYQISGR